MIIKKIRCFFVWMLSRQVLDAINAGAPFGEVSQLVETIAEDWKIFK